MGIIMWFRNDTLKDLEALKEEYENELDKLKRKVSSFDTTVLMHENNRLRDENKRLRELIRVYEKFVPNIEE